MYEVGKKQPYSDANLKNRLKAKEFIKFNDQRTQWKANNKNWKEFVKLARCYNLVMPGKQVFYGFLHNCERTELTDKCREPTIDADKWIQYCFVPDQRGEVPQLGEQRLFVELSVDWSEWIDLPKGFEIRQPGSDSEKYYNEQVEKGKKLLERTLLKVREREHAKQSTRR